MVSETAVGIDEEVTRRIVDRLTKRTKDVALVLVDLINWQAHPQGASPQAL